MSYARLRDIAAATRGVLQKKMFLEFRKIHRKTPSLKKRLWHRCFSMNFAEFPRTPFLQNTSGRLLLEISIKDNTDKHACYGG